MFVRIWQPLSEVYQRVQVLDFADAAPAIDAAQERHFCKEYAPTLEAEERRPLPFFLRTAPRHGFSTTAITHGHIQHWIADTQVMHIADYVRASVRTSGRITEYRSAFRCGGDVTVARRWADPVSPAGLVALSASASIGLNGHLALGGGGRVPGYWPASAA